MLCPKCNYTTFDFVTHCPKCKKDLSQERDFLDLLGLEKPTNEWILETKVEPKKPTEIPNKLGLDIIDY